jgi:hypothetical protein
MSQPRSVFRTSTGVGAMVAVIAGLEIAIGNPVFSIMERHTKDEIIKKDLQDIKEIVLSLAGLVTAGGGGLALIGRAMATTRVYTPDWLPGHNERDLTDPKNQNLDNPS